MALDLAWLTPEFILRLWWLWLAIAAALALSARVERP